MVPTGSHTPGDPSAAAALHSSHEPLMRSFWMAGFEGADHLNSAGEPLSMDAMTGHGERLDEDYGALVAAGIRTVRESVGWRLFEEGGDAARTRLQGKARVAREHGLQIVWTLMHYGLPRDLSLHDTELPARFAAFAESAARCVMQPGEVAWFQPVNEISFLCWTACEAALADPATPADPMLGRAIKANLVRTAIAGCDALWRVDPSIRIVHTDPLVHIHAEPGTPDLDAGAHEAWDMLCGRVCPELGGHPRYLDVIGANYYHSNQWVHGTREPLHWHLGDRRRRPLSQLLAALWQRYRRPLLLAETGHVGDGRAAWLDHIGTELERCATDGTPIEGVCLYPAIDRPDWDQPARWHASGLWQVDRFHVRTPVVPLLQRLAHWQARLPAPGKPLSPPLTGTAMTHLIVFSHLRWDFVYQRPQHLLSRIAPTYPVIFIEEPVADGLEPHLERLHPCAGVEVLRPHVSEPAPGFHDNHLATLQTLIGAHLAAQGIDDYWTWFYTPMALPVAARLTPRGVIYDCMDELGAFLHAPRQLLQRESALLRRADLVFTGGPSLHESKKARNDHVYCLPSSVDAAHFAAVPGQPEHPAQAALARPRLGYFGVIDERLDLQLVAQLAAARPDASIVMVGPVVKIDPASLPQAPNLHWLGQRPYDELPQLVAGWDVCLMPFAINAATQFISPTKTLEYMAAGKPIVSTPIRDVAEPYGHIVSIAASPEAFVRACGEALVMGEDARQAMLDAVALVLASTSWDRSAQAIADHIAQADARRPARPAAAEASTPARDWPTIVLGAGPTGLSAALHAGADCLLLEAQSSVGGWCRSVHHAGFTFDFAGHIMFSKDPEVLALYERLLGPNLHWQDREAWVYSHGVHTRYPFQGALYGLPPQVLKECLVGAIEARFGAIDGTRAPQLEPAAGAPRNFEDFIHQVWGEGVARHFAIPYNRKLWAVPLDEMETSWLGGRVPMPNLEEMIDGALSPTPRPMGPNARFGYPLQGGFQALMDGFLPLLEGPLMLDTRIVAVSPRERSVTLADGRQFGYGTLISTLGLPQLIAAIGDEAPESIREAAGALRHVSVRCVNIGVGRANLSDKHWIYYPEDTVFHRVFLQGNASPGCNPPGGFGLTCEITYAPGKPLPCDGQALIDRCIAECIEVGLFEADDPILTATQLDMPCAYVVYDHARAANVAAIREWLAAAGIVLAGRYSEWEYYNSDHAFLAGRKAADTAALRSAGRPPVEAAAQR